jgi:hypothetical protein
MWDLETIIRQNQEAANRETARIIANKPTPLVREEVAEPFPCWDDDAYKGTRNNSVGG